MKKTFKEFLAEMENDDIDQKIKDLKKTKNMDPKRVARMKAQKALAAKKKADIDMKTARKTGNSEEMQNAKEQSTAAQAEAKAARIRAKMETQK